MNILITGGCGYLASTLLNYIADNNKFKVTVLDNFTYNQYHVPLSFSDKDIEFVNYDIRLINKWRRLKDFDTVLHFAAIVGMPACNKNPQYSTEVNFGSVKSLVGSISKNQKLIFPMSNSGYGVKSDGICTEETPLEPISLYGVDKVKAEKYILGRENSITLRLATVFSTSIRQRLDLLVNDFCYKAYFDKKLVLYQPEFKRNFAHVKDISRCFLHCIANFDKMKGNCYNVGLDSANMSKLELAEKIKEFIPCEIEVRNDKEDEDRRDYRVSSQKMYDTGFKNEYTIENGIKDLIKLFSVLPKNQSEREKAICGMSNV